MRSVFPLLVLALSVLACAPNKVSLACRTGSNAEQLAARPSPFDSLQFSVGAQAASICYGRPSVRGRTIFGGIVAFDTLWRTGANEPTIINLPFATEIAGLKVERGSYSLYMVPNPTQFTLIVNGATGQWGIESAYADVRSEELGRVAVASEPIELVEQMTIRSEPGADAATDLLIEWERTRIRIPIKAAPVK